MRATDCRIILLLQEVPSARFCTREVFFFYNYNIGCVRCKRSPPQTNPVNCDDRGSRTQRHTFRGAHIREYPRFIFPPRSIRRTCQKMLNDCLRRAARSLPGEIDQTHNIRNEMACHTELFSVSRCSEGSARDNPLNKCARNRCLDNWGYYGYVLQVGDVPQSRL